MKKRRAKARMGRPPLPAAKRRSERVTVRMTPGEYARLQARARRAGLPLGVYLMSPWRQKKAPTDA